jgi:hypothetical protein
VFGEDGGSAVSWILGFAWGTGQLLLSLGSGCFTVRFWAVERSLRIYLKYEKLNDIVCNLSYSRSTS